MASRRKAGWVPEQHGAWAMLVVPLVAGILLRAPDGLPAWAWPLAATWLVGYFCFNAATLWLKAAATRRRRYLPAVLAYGGVAALAGLATLLLGGWPLLWWVPCFVPLLAVPLWLASRRREREWVSGLCTVVAACLMAWIIPFTRPSAVWHSALDARWWAAPALFGYFFGTVLVVKTLIRERGKTGWVLASIAWHLAWTAMAALLAPRVGAAWTAFFAVATVRAWALPWFGPRRGRVVRPGQVGVLEVFFSIAALLLCVL